MNGYAHPQYASSFKLFGTPLPLARSGGWLLKRKIPDTNAYDATGCYPIFVCRDWSKLKEDLDAAAQLVCVSLVTDPFGNYDESLLRDCFPDLVKPFKRHYVVDLSESAEAFVTSHHRRYARRALAELTVERCADPLEHLQDWNNLYSALVRRHDIKGLAAFSKEAFARQLAVPGIVALRATYKNSTVGMLLWYAQEGEVAYYHLGAYSAEGYELRASFALFHFAIEHFARLGFRWLNLGGGAGTEENQDSGLARFKRGWSTGTRTAYFCGRIFDRQAYGELAERRSAQATAYFPAYRAGESSGRNFEREDL